jgi:hypothetical protein
MNNLNSTTYKNWNISINECKEMCSGFSFDITDPCGKTTHVRLGGDSRTRALERAMEMIDLEMAFDEPKCSN